MAGLISGNMQIYFKGDMKEICSNKNSRGRGWKNII